MLARPTGLRLAEPLKITSTIESPRRVFADASPSTQRIASMMFDLPQPFGPTMPIKLLGNLMVVESTKDLKPESLILLRRNYRTPWWSSNGEPQWPPRRP